MGSKDDPSLHLPRLLCLHGGGVNKEVFHSQCRAFRYHLATKFRFVFADGPFLSNAGPGILPVYKDYGPFRRWTRWRSDHPEIDTETGIKELDYALQRTMEEDDRRGATGEWVGLLGFSQGAMVSASLLLRQQVRSDKLGEDKAGSNFRFAILFAGRAPLALLDPAIMSSPALLDPAGTAEGFDRYPATLRPGESSDHLLRLPTVHVHGLQDPGISWHRILLEQYFEKGTTRLVEWDGEHRVPIKKPDVDAVIKEIIAVATETGVF